MSKPQYDIDEAWVKRYREGKLSEAEQQWLAENSFEAEAVAGLAEAPDWSQDVPDLQQQLRQRTRRQATVWITYGRYAAAVAILIVAGWFVYRAVLPEIPTEQQSYEIQSDAPAVAEEAPLALVAPEKVEGETAASVVSNSVPNPPKQEIKPVPLPEPEPIALLESAATPALPEMMTDQEMAESSEAEADGISRNPEVSSEYQSRAKQARLAAPADRFGYQMAGRQVAGSVYSVEDFTPIPGANVLVKGTIVGTITDANGEFQVTVPDSSDRLVVSSIGYQSKEIAVNQRDSLTVQLKADTQALSEVVVTDYGTQNKKSADSQLAQPLPSPKAFRTYLQESLRYPEEARQQGVEGNVKVQFTVQANGELSDFTIKKSLGYGCDEEAIRLVREGPNWQPALQDGQPQNQEVTVKVRFRL